MYKKMVINPRITFILNIAYALLNLGLGAFHRTFWYFSLAGYYICLVVMRFILAHEKLRRNCGEKMLSQLKKYRACGIIFLLMNLALSLIIFFMVYWNRTFHHHEITTIALAAYTFFTFITALVNTIKKSKRKTPIDSALRLINLAQASVSMLTLEATMLTTFNDGSVSLVFRKIMLAISGGVVSVFVIALAVYMIVTGTKKIKLFKTAKE